MAHGYFFWIFRRPFGISYESGNNTIPSGHRKEFTLGKLRSGYHHCFEHHSDRPIADSAFHHGSARRQNYRLHCVLHPADRRDGFGRFDSFRAIHVDTVLLVLPRHGGPRKEPLHRRSHLSSRRPFSKQPHPEGTSLLYMSH